MAGLLAAVSDRLTNRLGENKTSYALFAAAGIACGASTLIVHPILSVLSVGLLRLSASVFAPISAGIQNRQIRIADRATMLSVYSSMMNTGAVGTNLIFGKLAEVDTRFALGIGAVFCFLGLALFAVWTKGPRTGAVAPTPPRKTLIK